MNIIVNIKSKLLPKDVSLKASFMGTELGNELIENVVRNIVHTQKEMNEKCWTPFTFIDYGANCPHKVDQSESIILETLVKGGKLDFDAPVKIKAGYLDKINNKYYVTDKLLNVISKIMEKHKQVK